MSRVFVTELQRGVLTPLEPVRLVSRVLRIVGDKCHQLLVAECPGLLRIPQRRRYRRVMTGYRPQGVVGGDVPLLGDGTVLVGEATLVDVGRLERETEIRAVRVMVHFGGILVVGDRLRRGGALRGDGARRTT